MAKETKKQSNFILRLDAQKDVRIGDIQPTKGRIKLAFSAVMGNMSKAIIVNFLFLLFVAPILVLLLYYVPTEIKQKTAQFAFMSEFGIGLYGQSFGDLATKGMIEIYKIRINLSYILIPCIAFLGIGASGLFMCARNFVWKVPLKPVTHFFRGVKMHWWKFALSFLHISVLVFLTIFSISNAQINIATSQNASGFITLASFSILFLFISMLFMHIALPMFVAYKYTLKQVIKNTIILVLSLMLTSVLILAALYAPMILLTIKITQMIIYIVLLGAGFILYATCITAFANYAFENIMYPVYVAQNAKNIRKEQQKQKNKQNTKNQDIKNTKNADNKRAKNKTKNTNNIKAKKYADAYKKREKR